VRRGDTVYLLGDYIDRGPDSKGVIDEILALQAAGHDIKPIRGNHEDLLLQAVDSAEKESYRNWILNGGKATLRSYHVSRPEEIPAAHLEFMRNLPHCRVTRRHALVHAGLDCSRNNPLTETSREFMLWERRFMFDSAKLAGRKLVTGHTVLDLDAIRGSLGNDHIRLDNGCFYGRNRPGKGNLVALELNSGELIVQPYKG
jgi:serine/threonine protein phosphatase 1